MPIYIYFFFLMSLYFLDSWTILYFSKSTVYIFQQLPFENCPILSVIFFIDLFVTRFPACDNIIFILPTRCHDLHNLQSILFLIIAALAYLLHCKGQYCFF